MPKKLTVARLSDYTDNVLQISREQALQDFQQHLKNNPEFDKVFLIAVDMADGEFDVNWFRGKIKCSEALAALAVVQNDLTRILRGEEIN